MTSNNEPTQQFEDFERIAIDPLSHNKEELLAAFRAGNTLLAQGIWAGGERAIEVFRHYEHPVEDIGLALSVLATYNAAK